MQPFGHAMLSWVKLRGIDAHSVSLTDSNIDSTKLYCLVKKDVWALVAGLELLDRKSAVSGIEPETNRLSVSKS